MALAFDELKPYKSSVLARSDEPSAGGDVDAVLDEIMTDLDELQPGIQVIQRQPETELAAGAADSIRVGFVHYRERRPPRWLIDGTIESDPMPASKPETCSSNSSRPVTSEPR